MSGDLSLNDTELRRDSVGGDWDADGTVKRVQAASCTVGCSLIVMFKLLLCEFSSFSTMAVFVGHERHLTLCRSMSF